MNLQDLKKVESDSISKATEDHRVFYAFSNEQFESSKTKLEEGEKYIQLHAGGFIPKFQLVSFIKKLDRIEKDFKNSILEHDLKERHIIYELQNHESFYTMDPSDAISALNNFYSEKEILEVFSKCVKSGEYND